MAHEEAIVDNTVVFLEVGTFIELALLEPTRARERSLNLDQEREGLGRGRADPDNVITDGLLSPNHCRKDGEPGKGRSRASVHLER
jgi:hypothetical protein